MSLILKNNDIENLYFYIDKISKLNNKFLEENGRIRRCYTRTYGCQQNENDTEHINGMLETMGFEFTDNTNDADLILFNTCAVREHAEQKVFGNLGALQALKRKNPDLIIIVCGCMAGQSQVVNQIKESYRQVNLVFDTKSIENFPENLYNTLIKKQHIFDTNTKQKEICEKLPIRRTNNSRAWITVMAGCNNFCSYCIVPYVRGRERSRKAEDILSEISALIDNGCKEITLLGQNVNSYNKDDSSGYDFSDLLHDINKINGDFVIKFMTSHPKDASKKLFDTIAECKKISRHIHLPFQSGSNNILDVMNRKYTREQYLDLIDYARNKIPNVNFTSDVIVGFPGETDDDFEQTLDLINRVGFSGLYTFKYSPRNGTPAAAMENQIPDSVKAERFERLLKLQNEQSVKYNSQFIGNTIKVIVEGISDKNSKLYSGRNCNDIIVQFDPLDAKISEGQTVLVHIEKALNWAIFGTIVR